MSEPMSARTCTQRAAAPRRRRSLRWLRHRRGATALLAVFAACWASTTAFAQLDPLLFIKRVPPTIIVVFDTSMRMLEDGNGNLYDPNFYRVSDDLAVMAAFPNINTTTTKTYRRIYQEPADRVVGQQVHGRHHCRDAGGVGSGEPADVERPGRSRVPGPDPL